MVCFVGFELLFFHHVKFSGTKYVVSISLLQDRLIDKLGVIDRFSLFH